MAKKSLIVKNQKRLERIKKNADKVAKLREILKKPYDTCASDEEKMQLRKEKWKAHKKASRMNVNSFSTRYRERCSVTGRPRGIYRRFGLSRIAIREMALAGYLPGVKKESL